MRQRQWNWEILDSRYYFSYGAPFVPWLQFVNFARRLPLPPPLPLPGASPAAAQADVVSIAESISILLPNNVFFFLLVVFHRLRHVIYRAGARTKGVSLPCAAVSHKV